MSLERQPVAGLWDAARVELPESVSPWCSVVVGALASPVTQATLVVDEAARTFVVPPHYADYHVAPARFARLVGGVLEEYGHHASEARVPLKTVAVAGGLARYGINNIAYVDGLGSYLRLAACVTDAPPPADAIFIEAQRLGRCGGCTACLHACPTGAVPGDRFVLHTDRCLTAVNESEEPFPEWVDPAWHACVVGCMRCQQACPENALVTLRVEPSQLFDETESAAILAAAEPSSLAAETRAKLAASGLDYNPPIIARDLRALLAAPHA